MRVKHHRKCRSNGGTNHQDNLSYVEEDQHRAWHRLFKNYPAHKIAEIINETWIDPQFKVVIVERRVLTQTEFHLNP